MKNNDLSEIRKRVEIINGEVGVVRDKLFLLGNDVKWLKWLNAIIVGLMIAAAIKSLFGG